MTEGMQLKGKYVIEARDAETNKLLQVWRFDNQLTSINQTLRTAMLTGTAGSTYAADMFEIKYFAFGDGTNPATAADTQLQNELFRKQVTQVQTTSAGVVQSIVSLTIGEANFNITEIGVFCGPDATSSANTGLLLSRVNVNINKNSNIVLNIVRSDVCTI